MRLTPVRHIYARRQLVNHQQPPLGMRECTRHLADGVHLFPTPAHWRQFIYDWRLLQLSAAVLDH